MYVIFSEVLFCTYSNKSTVQVDSLDNRSKFTQLPIPSEYIFPGQEMKVAVFGFVPFVGFQPDGTATGVDIDIVNEFAKKFGFSYTLKPTSFWGGPLPEKPGTWFGTIGEVIDW